MYNEVCINKSCSFNDLCAVHNFDYAKISILIHFASLTVFFFFFPFQLLYICNSLLFFSSVGIINLKTGKTLVMLAIQFKKNVFLEEEETFWETVKLKDVSEKIVCRHNFPRYIYIYLASFFPIHFFSSYLLFLFCFLKH